MFRFSEIEEEHLKGLLSAGKLDEFLDDLFLQFWELRPSVQYELINYIKSRKKYPSLKALQETFRITQEEARAFLKNPYMEFYVPVVGKESKMVRGLAVKGLKEVITNQDHLKSSMDTIRKFIGEGLALFFDDFFTGESYMLPAAVSLLVENLPLDVVFTGKIDEEGNVYEVNGIPKKRELAESLGLRLIEPGFIDNVRTLKEWYDAENYDVPLFITKTTENYEGELKNFYSSLTFLDVEKKIEMLELLSGVPKEKLVLITGQIPPEETAWFSVIHRFFTTIKEIEKALGGNETLHMGINGPTALAFSLGVIFGSQKPFVFYHFQDDKYHPIKVSKVRELKERVSEYRTINYSIEGEGKELAVILASAHHEPVASVKKFMKDKDATLLIVRHSKSGNIPVDEMKEVAKETASLIQDLRATKDYTRFHFFFACPVPVAFMLGVAFGYYSSGCVYQHAETQGYIKVVEFDRIRKIREEGT
ncbi:hypothetical protein BCF55_0966 [Hydrogenivirga caldilitoris]|uniref:SMODS-associated and fused to various effectors domain-containing protein n=1 Tax=Hydrogenivirga caldilitoris TaxID=246264 RepID=A0A497XP11_9AQUI|nr:SAVED domain-containing protein [Hydrogenivirga caldilitoris]RLJ70685.1 hypothetical protein BCF55_0966 [Hydrogenivirga caldilitoris]